MLWNTFTSKVAKPTFRPARPEIFGLLGESRTQFSLKSRRSELSKLLSEIDLACVKPTFLRAAVTYALRDGTAFHLAALPRRIIFHFCSCSRHALALVAARRYRARHTLSGAARPFAHPRRRRHAATTVLRVPDDSNYHLVARSHALSCCWDRAREPRKPREFCFQPKPSFDRPHRPHEHGVALSVRKVLYGYGTHGVCILDPPQTS